jgi:Ca2+-transporting ATPase
MLGVIFANRSLSRSILATLRSPNPALWWVIGGALGFLLAVLYVPFFRDVFRFTALPPIELAICLTAGGLSILGFELVKAARNRRGEKQ